MSLASDLIHELNRAAQAGCTLAAPQAIAVPVPGGNVSAQLVAIDSIGCSFIQLACRIDRLAQASIDDLKQVADQLAQRVTYLLEPIQPVEVDRDQCVVQLRSKPPRQGDDGSRYYEVLARRGELVLARWQQPRGAARQVIPADVTREVFVHLATDLASFA